MRAICIVLACAFAFMQKASAMETTMMFTHAPHEDGEVYLYVPDDFNPRLPARIVVYFHGDIPDETFDHVLARQKIAEQIRDAHVNAMLVAPHLGPYSAAKWCYKNFTDGGFTEFMAEAKEKLARRGDFSIDAFDRAYTIGIAYSGGFGALKAILKNGADFSSILMLDSHYREQDVFVDAAGKAYWKGRTFVSAYTDDTIKREQEFEEMLAEKRVPIRRNFPGTLLPGSVVLLHVEGADADELHTNFATHAWTENPIEDFLRRVCQ